jgi:hypothetical protein
MSESKFDGVKSGGSSTAKRTPILKQIKDYIAYKRPDQIKGAGAPDVPMPDISSLQPKKPTRTPPPKSKPKGSMLY